MGWYGFDLDGTLANDDGVEWPAIGAPVPDMVAYARHLIETGKEIRIVTARVSHNQSPHRRHEQFRLVNEWCAEHLGREVVVTAEKDHDMTVLYDDRARQVVRNAGIIVEAANRSVLADWLRRMAREIGERNLDEDPDPWYAMLVLAQSGHSEVHCNPALEEAIARTGTFTPLGILDWAREDIWARDREQAGTTNIIVAEGV